MTPCTTPMFPFGGPKMGISKSVFNSSPPSLYLVKICYTIQGTNVIRVLQDVFYPQLIRLIPNINPFRRASTKDLPSRSPFSSYKRFISLSVPFFRSPLSLYYFHVYVLFSIIKIPCTSSHSDLNVTFLPTPSPLLVVPISLS